MGYDYNLQALPAEFLQLLQDKDKDPDLTELPKTFFCEV